MLIQTKQAIDALKKAGFARSEFSVRAERNVFTYESRQIVEHGLAQISLNVSLERKLNMIDAMLKVGISVTKWTRKDGSCFHISVEHDGKGQSSQMEAR